MSNLKCPGCGDGIVRCDYCGDTYTTTSADRERAAFLAGRRSNFPDEMFASEHALMVAKGEDEAAYTAWLATQPQERV